MYMMGESVNWLIMTGAQVLQIVLYTGMTLRIFDGHHIIIKSESFMIIK